MLTKKKEEAVNQSISIHNRATILSFPTMDRERLQTPTDESFQIKYMNKWTQQGGKIKLIMSSRDDGIQIAWGRLRGTGPALLLCLQFIQKKQKKISRAKRISGQRRRRRRGLRLHLHPELPSLPCHRTSPPLSSRHLPPAGGEAPTKVNTPGPEGASSPPA